MSDIIKANRFSINAERGKILTSRMLEVLYEMPQKALSAAYCEYPDGIVSGYTVEKKGDDIILSGGIIKLDGILYFSDNEFSLTQFFDGIDTVNVLYFEQSDDVSPAGLNVIEHPVVLNCAPLTAKSYRKRVVLGRFNSSEMELPESFDDLCSGSNYTFNLVVCDYSTFGKKALHPYISQLLLNKLRSKQTKDHLDIQMIMLLSSGMRISHDAITAYIAAKNNRSECQWDPDNILKKLREAVKKTVGASGQSFEAGGAKPLTPGGYAQDMM